MPGTLAEILSPEELYDYRAESHIDLSAPYQQGDIFRLTEPEVMATCGGASLVMLFMHPCTMRRAGVLEESVTVVRVKQESPRKVLVRPDFWQSNYKVMPLPDLAGDGRSTHAADFMHISTIPSASLPRTARIAQLSTAGRIRMQQRLINHFTRYIVSTDVLSEATAHIEEESLYQSDWVAAAVRAGTCAGDHLPGIEELEKEYQEYLDTGLEGESNLRELLKSVETRPRATRQIQMRISELYPRPQ